MTKQSDVTVVDQTTVLEKVGAITRVYFGVAIGFGFIASALGFALMPGLQSKKIVTIGNLPLQVIDVVRAISVRDPEETIPFEPQRYFAGSTLVYEQEYQGGTADTSYQVGSLNQKLTISLNTTAVNTPASTGFTNQYIMLWYRQVGDIQDRLTTVCLGQTSATSVYVGVDGSTYSDSRLVNRTTQKSCSQLNQLNSGVEQLSDGAANMALTNQGEYAIVRTARVLARFNDESFQAGDPIVADPNLVAQFLANFRSPLWIGFSPASDGQGSFSTVIPQAIFRLVDTTTIPSQTITQYLCHPGGTVNTETTGPAFFFDRDGNAYRDIFLTNRYLTTDCPVLREKMRLVSHVTNVTKPTTIAWPESYVSMSSAPNSLGNYHSDGRFIDSGPANVAPFGPLSIYAQLPKNPVQVYTIPTTPLTITQGDGTSFNICFPATTVDSVTDQNGDSNPYYFDRNGQPYSDPLFTAPVSCTLPGDVNPTPVITNIQVSSISPTSATVSWDTNVSTCGRINYGTVAGLLNSGPVGDSCYQTTNSPYTTGHQATLTGLTANTVYYYEIVSTNNLVSGQKTFTTTNPAPAYTNIRIISTGSSYITIGWDTARTTCSNINYGTVSGQLNTGPAGETTPCTGTTHQATITGLLPATAYFYEIVGVNGTAQVVSGQQSFTTSAGTGNYLNIRVINTTATSATIGWDTARTTCSNINYGTFNGQLNSGPVAETAPCTGTSHLATINGLTASTRYYFEIIGGGTIVSGQQTFTTAPVTYTTGAYTNIRIISTGSSYVTLGWDTTRTTCSNINFGTVSGQLNTGPVGETVPCNGTSHQATLTGLTPNTIYLYEIVGIDGFIPVVSGQQTFTTLASTGYYSNIRVISTTPTTATIGWNTLRTTCSRINYGTVPSQLNSGPVSEVSPCTGPSHQTTITNLTAGKVYYYEVIGGGAIVSGQQTFRV